jgi:hypothetical protein
LYPCTACWWRGFDRMKVRPMQCVTHGFNCQLKWEHLGVNWNKPSGEHQLDFNFVAAYILYTFLSINSEGLSQTPPKTGPWHRSHFLVVEWDTLRFALGTMVRFVRSLIAGL